MVPEINFCQKMEQQEILLDLPQETEKKAAPLLSFSDFLKNLELQKDPEEKIRNCILFMQQCLSREGPPSFKEFWETRKLCLLLFKESLNPKVRNELWERYIGLTTEAYHLKEMMDNESSFARQQIEAAIQDLEKNLDQSSALAQQVCAIELPEECARAAAQSGSYNRYNQELHLLHSFAERVHALRQEVLKTQMRFRFKNKLLDQLMGLGDRVFPRRKELTQLLSQLFLTDVESYVERSFSKELEEQSGPALKDTIKAFQFVAKQLYLNAESVSKTKELLNQCWQKVQARQQERKSQLLQQKEADRALHQEHQEKRKLKEEIENERQKQFQLLKSEIQELLEAEIEADALQKKYSFFEEEKARLILQESEEALLDSLMRQLKIALFDKRQKALLAQPEASDFGHQLEELLDEKKKIRQELKKELESVRKQSGSSGLDFEKAMFYRDFMESGKQLLERLELSIIEIEEKLFDIEK